MQKYLLLRELFNYFNALVMMNFRSKVMFFWMFLSIQFGFSQIGINTVSPKSTLDINGNISLKTVTLVGSNNPTPIDDGTYISVSPQMQDHVFMLPSATMFPGRYYVLRNVSPEFTAAIGAENGLFFYKNSAAESNPSTHMIYLYEGNRTVFVISDGTNWTVFN